MMERSDLEQWKSREVARLLALVETERRYWQEIVSTLPVCLAILNSEQILVSANRAFRTRFGVRSEDLRNRRLDAVLPFPEVAQYVSQVFEQRTSSTPLTIDLPAEAGRIRVSVQPHRDWDEDTSIQVLLVVEDLSGSAPQTEVSAAAPAHTSALALPAELPAVVWTASLPSLQFTSVSESSIQVTGIPVERWNEASFWTARFAEADRDAMTLHYNRAVAAGGLHSFEFRLAENPRWFRETIRVEAGAGKVHGILSDITERRSLEEHILYSQRMDSLAGFAGRASHDLNNPLMIVSGYGEELFESFTETDPRRNDMGQVLAAAKRIGDISAGMQAFSRRPLPASDVPFVDLSETLSKTVERMRNTAGPSLQVDYEGPPPGFCVRADEGALQNLIYEITAAMADGAPEVHISIQAREGSVRDVSFRDQLPPGAYAIVTIENRTGGAASDAGVKRVFESILPSKDGSEVGLALAKAFRQVESWGGSIWPSMNARHIRILLLAQKNGLPILADKPRVPEPPPVAVMPPPPKRIMVVDDEMGIRSLMRKILMREGYNVSEAGNAKDAIAAIEKDPVDLLLTDVVMPEVSGRELAEQVVAAYPETRVLYVSGFTGETLVESGQFPPGSQLLQKPFTLGSLLRKVREVLATAAPAS